jgi:hypothetical protein
VLVIADYALGESEVTVTRSYLVLNVFRLAASMFATIFTLVLVMQFVESVSADRSPAFGIGVKVVSLLLCILAIAQIGFYIYVTVYNIDIPDLSSDLAWYVWARARYAVWLAFDSVVLATLLATLAVLLLRFRSGRAPKVCFGMGVFLGRCSWPFCTQSRADIIFRPTPW